MKKNKKTTAIGKLLFLLFLLFVFMALIILGMSLAGIKIELSDNIMAYGLCVSLGMSLLNVLVK